MTQSNPHSNALCKGRFSAPGLTYFVTGNVHNRQPLLDAAAREIVIESLLWARTQGRIWLLGYVIMDDQFHALLVLQGETTLALFTEGLKRHTARQNNKRRSEAGGFWQEGYHDHAIRDEADLWHHVQYMHENPVRRGLVSKSEDYVWSTAHASRQQDMDWDKIGYAQ